MTAINLSVIIPAYNAAATLERGLQSVLAQECQARFEVIVCDDASTDQSPELAKDFPVRLLRLEQNLGAGGARNRGAKEAQGEILVFVDSDVFLSPGGLANIDKLFAECTEVAAAVGSYTALPADFNCCTVYHNCFTVYHHDQSPDEIEWFWGALSAVRKEVFEKLGGFSQAYPGASAEDIELGYRLSEAGHRIRYFPKLRGIHGRRFSFSSMAYNDYHKAVLGLKLYLLRKPAGKHQHGFSSPLNGINVMLAPLCWLSLAAFPLAGFWPQVLLAMVFVAINSRFYSYILKSSRTKYLVPSIFLHWLSFNFIAAGMLGGLLGLLLGKGIESRSRWI
jgi:glycosyltransferase involved in cell wall biosynthesis